MATHDQNMENEKNKSGQDPNRTQSSGMGSLTSQRSNEQSSKSGSSHGPQSGSQSGSSSGRRSSGGSDKKQESEF